MSLDYKVGQVLYVVFKGEKRVVPLQIIEEITRKTLEGLKVDYKLRSGPEDKSFINFNDIDGDVFETPELAIEVLTDRAKNSIEKIVSIAAEKAKTLFSVVERQVKENVQQESEDAQEEEVRVKLPDGSYARVKFPVSNVG